MATKIFVNLPVKDLKKSIEFFQQLGYSFNQQFTDETAACMVISEDIYAMLLTHEKFSQFTSKKIADATQTTEVLTCLSAESKDKVNELVNKALTAGATEAGDPQDYGFMFGRSFNDLDGHIWEIMWMDEAAIQQQQAPVSQQASLN
ncbi:MAG TPA: VOC family protein [Flavisolibacter sp.]|nr:VOC family protein [Flavisolibacter sp.]